MSNGSSELDASEQIPTATEVHAQLNEICQSERFRNSPVLKAILGFFVDLELFGEAQSPSASEIAVHALGNGSEFRSKTDSSVRVACKRLCNALDYYNAKRDPRVVIRFEPDCNRPKFEFRPPRLDTAAEALFF